MPNRCMSIASKTAVRHMSDTVLPCCRAGEYDDRRRAKLLSLGNRSVRNVKRDFSSGVFAYTAAVKGRWPWQLLVAALLVMLLATLATSQYRWLGEVSDAERDR